MPHRPSSPRGAMTAVMSAQSLTELPRRLRLALVRDGRLIEERSWPIDRDISVGSDSASALVLPDDAGVRSHRLFVATSSGIELRAPEGATTRLHAAGVAADARVAPLSLGSRGKVVLGRTTLLFQLTVAPPVAPRPRLPESVKVGLFRHLDWGATVIAAFSFLVHFGAVGSLYTDWNDRIVADTESLLSVLPRLTAIPPTPVEPTAEPTPDNAPPSPAPSPDRTPSPDRPVRSPTHARSTSTPSDTASVVDALSRIGVGQLAVLNSSSPSTRSVLQGAVPSDNLDAFAQANAGVEPDPLAIRRSGTSGPIGPGQRPTLATALAGSERATGPGTASDTPAAPTVQRPTAPAPTSPIGPAPDDAQRVLAMARIKARRCYEGGLSTNPDMEGNLGFSLQLSGSGSVIGASFSPSGNLSAPVVSCIQGVLRGLSFEGKGQASTVNGSFRLVNQARKP